MGRTVRIFHISDLHARGAGGPQGERARREAPMRWRVLRKEWDQNLEELRADGRPVDLVAFTGDLADWGHETDYPLGIDLLQRTCRALEVAPDRLFVVPGNHDIARTTEEAAWRAVRDGAGRAERAVSSWMAGGRAPAGLDDAWRDAILRRQASFWKAMADLGRGDLDPRSHRHGRLGYRVELRLAGLAAPLWVIGLDTAWLAGDEHDTGSLRLTEHQVEHLASSDEGADLPGFRLALMHHRFADLADGDRMRRLLADRADLVLHGHQHEPAVDPWASPDHALLVLAAGCLYEGDEGHRYPNACQLIDLELTDAGRPERAVIRFRGWADRNGFFWGDDGLLYRSARGGRLALLRRAGGWGVDEATRPEAPRPPAARATFTGRGDEVARSEPWRPAASEVFVGRGREIEAIERAIAAVPGARVAVVAVQGMAGVGKSFLVEQFCARHAARFGAMCRWVLDPTKLGRAEAGLVEIARQAGLDPDRTAPAEIPALLADRRVLLHIDNVDSAEAAAVVVELLARLPALPAIVTGRYTALGTTPGARWARVPVECLDDAASVALLRAELGEDASGGDAPDEPALRALAAAVGGLPLALHLAAGYLRGGYSAAGFLERLRASGLALEPVDPADPIWRSRSQGIVSVSLQLSKELFLAEAARRGEPWAPALSALGWAAPSGFGRELGAAIAGLAAGSFEAFIHAATSLSLLRRVPKTERPDGAWSVHPLVAELLRVDVPRAEVDRRIEAWVVARGEEGHDDDRAARWAALSRESAAIDAWLTSADDAALARVFSHCWLYAASHGPIGPWLEAARRVCGHRNLDERAVECAWAWAKLAARVGSHEEVLRAADLLDREGDGARDGALAAGLRADVLTERGELDEALRIRRDDELPVYEGLGDAWAKAATLGQIADILETRGELEEALRIRREDQLPVYARLGEARDKAVTTGKIAGILGARGDLDEALRILREDVLPVFEHLGDLREKAMAMAKIAEILQHRGELAEVLRILREDVLPVWERLGEAHSRAVTMGKIADILRLRGELDEALRIRREDVLPIYERLGEVREKAVTVGQIADILEQRGELDEALRIRRQDELPVYERVGDARSKAVTMAKIAHALRDRGDLEEALRIYREDVLPSYERRGGNDLLVGLANLGTLLIRRGLPADLVAARQHLERAAAMAAKMRIPFPEYLQRWLASDAGRS